MNGYKPHSVSLRSQNYSTADSSPTAEEEKERRCSPSTVSRLAAIPANGATAATPLPSPPIADSQLAAIPANGATAATPLPSSPIADPQIDPDPDKDPDNTGEPSTALDPGDDVDMDPGDVADPVPATAGNNAPNFDTIRPILAAAGNNAFDINGILEDFMDEAIVSYLAAVPGGGRWAEVVQSYLVLVRLSPAKEVGRYYFLLKR